MGGILCNYVNCCAKGLAYISTNYLTKYYNFEISNCFGGGGGVVAVLHKEVGGDWRISQFTAHY